MSGAELLDHINTNFKPTWPFILEKADVKGPTATPLFMFLRNHKNCSGWFGNDIKWSFTKFLIDRNGVPQKRFAPKTAPLSIVKDIEKLLAQSVDDL